MRRARCAAAATVTTLLLAALDPACGSKSGLPGAAGPSAAFCASAEYSSGARDLAIYILLDRSESMQNDDKWIQASAALAAFVNDPATQGVAVALGYYPHDFECDSSSYVAPAVFATGLPEAAPSLIASLAAQSPAGGTPTRPALHGAIQFSRALMLAEPTRRMVVALVSDGAPTTCDSTPESAAAVAADGVSGTPQVLTYAIGLRKGAVGDLELLAAKGGTGKPVLVSDGPGAGQELVDALRALRQGQTECRFAVPQVSSSRVTANDLRVAFRSGESGGIVAATRVSASAECTGASGGYFLRGDDAPTEVVLCPALCELLRNQPGSEVTVVAGCGGGSDGGEVLPALDGGDCGGSYSIACVKACGQVDVVPPICTAAQWECPPGSIEVGQCTACAPVPHACCMSNGTLADAQCIDGAWLCPPGGTPYGSGACKAPAVCSAALPCAVGQYCESPNFTCGAGPLAGHCVPQPTACEPGGPVVCGCDGAVHPNACAARQQGVDLSQQSSCPSPVGEFACGPLFCTLSTEICRRIITVGGPVPLDDFACLAAPAGCASGCCKLCPACPANGGCTEICSDDGAGERLLSCYQ